MGVAVEQAGQHPPPGQIDPLIAIQASADPDDPTFLDGDIGHRGICAGAVEDQAAGEERARHGEKATIGA